MEFDFFGNTAAKGRLLGADDQHRASELAISLIRRDAVMAYEIILQEKRRSAINRSRRSNKNRIIKAGE